jgi:hypothetical protein
VLGSSCFDKLLCIFAIEANVRKNSTVPLRLAMRNFSIYGTGKYRLLIIHIYLNNL